MTSTAIVTLVIELIRIAPDLVERLLTEGRRTGELSDAEAAAFRQRMTAAFAAPHWQPRPPAEGGVS